VSHRDLRLPPISLWEHRQAVRELRAQGRRSLDQATIFAAVLEQRKILDSFANPARANVNSRNVEAGLRTLAAVMSMLERKIPQSRRRWRKSTIPSSSPSK
jgi:hypothetical protein